MLEKGFQKAVKYESKLRLALCGPTGSGKTYTSLVLGQRIANIMGELVRPAPRIALVDTERGSASKYADLFDFDVLELQSFNPREYVKAIKLAEEGGYGVLVIDSLSHAWAGKDGALEMVDNAAATSGNSNKWVAWRTVTPEHNKLVDAMLGSNLHLIVTMRSKMGYIQTTDQNGKAIIQKIGMQPIQRDGIEYEFDIVGDMDVSNTLIVSKTRCPELTQAVVHRPDASLADRIMTWLHGVEIPFCQVHECQYQWTKSKTGKSGWAHRASDGTWCAPGLKLT